MKHKFYVIEGVDTSGKTEVARVLRRKLKASCPKIKMKGSPDTREIYDKKYYREYVERLSDEIKKLLKKGPVVQVRYIYSSLVHEYLIEKKINKIPSSIIRPDKVIYLKVSPEEVEKRFLKRKKRSKRESKINIKRMMKLYTKVFPKKKTIVIDTTGKKVNETVKEIMEKLK